MVLEQDRRANNILCGRVGVLPAIMLLEPGLLVRGVCWVAGALLLQSALCRIACGGLGCSAEVSEISPAWFEVQALKIRESLSTPQMGRVAQRKRLLTVVLTGNPNSRVGCLCADSTPPQHNTVFCLCDCPEPTRSDPKQCDQHTCNEEIDPGSVGTSWKVLRLKKRSGTFHDQINILQISLAGPLAAGLTPSVCSWQPWKSGLDEGIAKTDVDCVVHEG